MPKQLLYIYKKALIIPENGFFGNNTWQEKAKFWAKSPKKNAFSHKKMVKKALRGQNLARIFDFGSRLSSFRAENTSKSFPFRQKIAP